MEIISIHKIDLGFDVEEEIENSLKEEINEQTINHIKEAISLMDSGSQKIEKNNEECIEQCIEIIRNDGKIHKDIMNKIMNSNTISSVGKLRNYILRLNKKLIKSDEKDFYTISD